MSTFENQVNVSSVSLSDVKNAAEFHLRLDCILVRVIRITREGG